MGQKIMKELKRMDSFPLPKDVFERAELLEEVRCEIFCFVLTQIFQSLLYDF